MTRTLLELIGAAVCRWKGKHRMKRVKNPRCEIIVTRGGADVPQMPIVDHNVCTRCGTVRPVRSREAKSTGKFEVYETVVTRDGAVVKQENQQ